MLTKTRGKFNVIYHPSYFHPSHFSVVGGHTQVVIPPPSQFVFPYQDIWISLRDAFSVLMKNTVSFHEIITFIFHQ